MGLGVSVPVVRFIVRVMCSVLGLFVRQSDPHLRDANVRVYIANHVTHFDHSVINLLTSCNTPALNGTPGFICWSRGFMELGAVGSRAELVDSLKVYSSHGGNPPLLLFPEEAATNGRVGLLRFSSWPFSILDVIQPVALQVQRPLIAVSVADSSWITELLWTFFVPFTVYQVRWMPPVFRQADEPNEEFALRVQELLAVELGVVSTRLTAADKAEHMKRLRHTPPHLFAPASSQSLVARPRASPSLAGVGPLAPEDVRITEMVQRVKEVLPHVSLGTIRRDLGKRIPGTFVRTLWGRGWLLPFNTRRGGLGTVVLWGSLGHGEPLHRSLSFSSSSPSNRAPVSPQPRPTAWTLPSPTSWRARCPSSLRTRIRSLACLLRQRPRLQRPPALSALQLHPPPRCLLVGRREGDLGRLNPLAHRRSQGCAGACPQELVAGLRELGLQGRRQVRARNGGDELLSLARPNSWPGSVGSWAPWAGSAVTTQAPACDADGTGDFCGL
uniref:AUP1 lipid droplet regulating VLDL assembly factor n=1 Tax=Chrysemys picta bellii TaxID=8478 RepID=A0A8C3IJP1_CHRPI